MFHSFIHSLIQPFIHVCIYIYMLGYNCMLCYALLCNTMLCYNCMLYYAMLCYNCMLCYAMLRYAILCYNCMLRYAMLYYRRLVLKKTVFLRGRVYAEYGFDQQG